MKKIIGIVSLVFLMMTLSALEVDRNEVELASAGAEIEFINYVGPHTVIDTIEEIRGIGEALGETFRAGPSATGTSGDANKYYVIHAVDPAIQTGFDADILIIGPNAEVDHIDNLRRIISSYLMRAYGYSDKDSATLATFITVYNAVYRGKIDAFKAKYKPLAVGYLTVEKVGLSVRYNEWAGRSQIVIPLSNNRLAGTISTIDTTAITGKDVVEKIKEDKATATDTRKDMAELKERETDAAQARAEAAQKDAAAARVEEQRKKDELAAAQKAAQTAAAAAEKKQTPEAIKEAEEKAALAEQKKEEVKEIASAVAKKEEDAKADQTLADTKQKEALTERKEIATDIQKELDQKTEAAKAASDAALASAVPGFGLKVVDGTSLLAEIVLVNLNDGTVLKSSSLNTIRGRTLFDTGSGLIAIAGKKGGNNAVKLVLIDPSTLEITKQGNDSIAENSVLVQNANDFYAIIETGGSFVVGRFDKTLEAKVKSAVQVQPYSPITVTPKGLLVQDSSGKIKLLRATDLSDQSK